MQKFISPRLRLGKEFYIWGWKWVMFVVWGLPYGLASVYDLIRGEWRENLPSLSKIFPDWLPVLWLVLGVIAFIIMTFEGAYRIIQRREKGNDIQSVSREPTVLEIIETTGSNYQQMGESWGLLIENKGITSADDCRGQLIEIEFANPEDGLSMGNWPINYALAWAEQEGTSLNITNSFNIPGKERRVLQVVHWDGKHNGKIEIAYLATPDFRKDHAMPNNDDAVCMVISITSSNHLPIYAVCRWKNKNMYEKGAKLELINTTNHKPSISDYQQLKSHKGDSQT